MDKSTIKPPPNLSAATKRWFAHIATTYELESHHLRLLELAGRSWDRAEQARKVLKREGVVTIDRYGQTKAHPCINIERDSQLRFARLIRELNLDEDQPGPRPPRIGGRE